MAVSANPLPFLKKVAFVKNRVPQRFGLRADGIWNWAKNNRKTVQIFYETSHSAKMENQRSTKNITLLMRDSLFRRM